MAVAQRLKQIVEDRGTTYSHLARKTGIPVNTISAVMLGKRRLLADELISLCQALDIDLPDLLKE